MFCNVFVLQTVASVTFYKIFLDVVRCKIKEKCLTFLVVHITTTRSFLLEAVQNPAKTFLKIFCNVASIAKHH